MKKYGPLSIDSVITINKNINLVFIAIANELHMYFEAL